MKFLLSNWFLQPESETRRFWLGQSEAIDPRDIDGRLAALLLEYLLNKRAKPYANTVPSTFS
jgi:hypothetical protein